MFFFKKSNSSIAPGASLKLSKFSFKLSTLIFILIPIGCSFFLSFTEWDLLNELKFVGLENYKLILNKKQILFLGIILILTYVFLPNLITYITELNFTYYSLE